MFKDSRLPGTAVYVRVYLRGQYRLVPEHLLHHTQVRPVFNQMGGERMSEGVRGYFLADAGQEALLLYHIEDGHAAERLSEPVEESEIAEFRSRRGRAHIQPGGE